MIEIEVVDPVYCKINKEGADIIRPIVSYTAVFYQKGPYRNVRNEYQKSTMFKDKAGRNYIFFTGLLPTIEDYLIEKKLHYKIKDDNGWTLGIPNHEPKLPILRPEQLELVKIASEKQRGVIQAPTGSGKTVIGLGILSCFSEVRTLWLCHTKDLMYQAQKQLLDKKFLNVGIIGDGSCQPERTNVVSTRQSLIKLVTDEEIDPTTYDIIIVDETHHVADFSGQYAKILTYFKAPVRIGLTATMPDKEESKLACEAFLGPLIGRLSIEEAHDLDIVAKPKIKITKIPINHKLREMRKYQDVYDWGIVKNKLRNNEIANIVKEHTKKGDSVLILVTKIEHGREIEKACIDRRIDISFVMGSTDGETRQIIKQALNEKEIQAVICTAIWKEGVDIPELNVVINAAGGKSEIQTLQSIGRGLRRTAKKSEIIIYDFFDESHYHLISHFGSRIAIYCEQGWI